MNLARVAVPVLTLRNTNGRIDAVATREYAQRAVATWIDVFILCGTIGEGEQLDDAERRQVIETWSSVVPTERLVACAWQVNDFHYIDALDLKPMSVLQGFEDESALLRSLAELPPESYVYSHPKYSPVTFSDSIAHRARKNGSMPGGGKICKVSLAEVSALRKATGHTFALYDGRCRHVARSVDAGATGVIAVPLSYLPRELPDRDDAEALQRLIDQTQARIDSTPTLAGRMDLLTRLLRAEG